MTCNGCRREWFGVWTHWRDSIIWLRISWESEFYSWLEWWQSVDKFQLKLKSKLWLGFRRKPMTWLEQATHALRKRCSTSWATSATKLIYHSSCNFSRSLVWSAGPKVWSWPRHERATAEGVTHPLAWPSATRLGCLVRLRWTWSVHHALPRFRR